MWCDKSRDHAIEIFSRAFMGVLNKSASDNGKSAQREVSRYLVQARFLDDSNVRKELHKMVKINKFLCVFELTTGGLIIGFSHLLIFGLAAVGFSATPFFVARDGKIESSLNIVYVQPNWCSNGVMIFLSFAVRLFSCLIVVLSLIILLVTSGISLRLVRGIKNVGWDFSVSTQTILNDLLL